MAIWTFKDAAKATNGKTSGTWEARGVVIDSRAIKGGELFVALKGERVDGHEYVTDALSRGAAAAMVSHAVPGVDAAKLLIVPDVQKGLEALGAAGRARAKAKIVAVTGSVGKTSAKEMLKLALAPHGSVFASHGNFNNHIGAPLNLANLPPDAQLAVFELGMNHAGEISALTQQVRPHVALITTVEAVHLEFFTSVEAIADAKSEIFEGLEKGGVAILNADNAQFGRLAAAAKNHGLRVLQCGSANGVDSQLIDYIPLPSGCQIRIKIENQEIEYGLSATGRHWALLSLMVLTAVHSLGLDAKISARNLLVQGFREPEGRGQQVPLVINGRTVLLIDDSYNASPASMAAAIAKTAELFDARHNIDIRKIAALGDMRELGPDAPQFHKKLAEILQKHGFHKVFTAGPMMQHLHDALPPSMRATHTPDAASLLPILRDSLQTGDIVLVKGSHGSLMYTIADALKNPEETRAHAV